ncbi:hypothetical protein IMSAG049_01128 [Clostridiales bacterium]|nr:hypothetical protein IMSAG049_01128 [Clostridiales bacterium]
MKANLRIKNEEKIKADIERADSLLIELNNIISRIYPIEVELFPVSENTENSGEEN